MTTTTRSDINDNASSDDLIWAPRPDREVLLDDLDWGCVIRGEDGGYTTIDETDYEAYYSEFGRRTLEDDTKCVTVVADDDIMSRSGDMRGRTADELLRFVGEEPSSNYHWHDRINQLFLWEVVTTMSDWDNAVAEAETTKTGQAVLRTFHRPAQEIRQAIENGLARHTAKNAALGLDRRLYRVNW